MREGKINKQAQDRKHRGKSSLGKIVIRSDGSNVVSLPRIAFEKKHEEYRQRVRAFLQQHVVPDYETYCRAGCIPKKVYKAATDEGIYSMTIPKEYGGKGLSDFRYNAVVCEELEALDVGGFFANLGNDMVLPYFLYLTTPEQRRRWLPDIAQNGRVLAVAMSEPEVGSDLGALSTRAVEAVGEGGKDGFEITGRKMWISAGSVCDYVVVAAVTDPTKGSKGISLFVVEADRKGFEVAKRVAKIGKHASDTCLLTFDRVWVPKENMIGSRGDGFRLLMTNLSKERLSIAIGSAASARRVLALTVNYVQGRRAFGGSIGGLQSVQTTLARLRVEIDSCTSFVDRCIVEQARGKLSAESASIAKYLATDLAHKTANQCLQLFGGYGYLKNSPVARHFVDSRVPRIYGGANEVMLEIASRGLGFRPQRFRRNKTRNPRSKM
eukprot:jgi/Bigna1/40595/e_gw1.44.30.1